MRTAYTVLEQHGVPVWIAVCLVIAALMAGWVLGYLNGERVAVAAPIEPAADSPDPAGWVPEVPDDLPPWPTDPPTVQWVFTVSGVVHLPTCRHAPKGRPWLWPDTVSEARRLADEQGLRPCGRCHPFAEHNLIGST